MTASPPTEAGDMITPPEHGWDCFHCGEHFPNTFGGQRDARNHFGATPDAEPACLLVRKDKTMLMLVRELQARETELLGSLHEETGDAVKALRRRESQYAEEVRQAEETGYARGLRDLQKQVREALACSAVPGKDRTYFLKPGDNAAMFSVDDDSSPEPDGRQHLRELLNEARPYLESFCELSKHPTAGVDAAVLIQKIRLALTKPDCPVCFVPWGACEHTNPPKARCQHHETSRALTGDGRPWCTACGSSLNGAEK